MQRGLVYRLHCTIKSGHIQVEDYQIIAEMFVEICPVASEKNFEEVYDYRHKVMAEKLA
jgi:hypothetical protein